MLKPPIWMPVNRAHPVMRDLVLFLLFNEGTGPNVRDLADHEKSLREFALASPAWVGGSNGFALSFNGSSDEIDCGTDSDFNIPGPISIEVMAISNQTTLRIILSKMDAAADGWNLAYVNQHLYMRANSGTCEGTIDVIDGKKHHLVGVYNGNDIIVYVDGAEDSRKTVGSITLNVSNELYIGRYYTASLHFDGVMEYVRIWDRALDESEIYTLARDPYCMF